VLLQEELETPALLELLVQQEQVLLQEELEILA
jgi:hypothetical protein